MHKKYCVYDIRGSCASGKSTLVRNILKRYENEVILDEDIPYHWVPELNLCILGRYDMKGSGVDNVKGSDRIQSFMESKLKHHNVMLEGVIISHVFARWNEMASSKKWKYRFFHLNVDLDTCIERVKKRRLKRGDKRPFNPENTTRFLTQTAKTIGKLKDAGRWVMVLDNPTKKEAYLAVIRQIKKDLKKQSNHEEEE